MFKYTNEWPSLKIGQKLNILQTYIQNQDPLNIPTKGSNICRPRTRKKNPMQIIRVQEIYSTHAPKVISQAKLKILTWISVEEARARRKSWRATTKKI